MDRGELIPKNTLPDYWDNELWFMIDVGSKSEKYGNPFAKGWSDTPCHIFDCIELYDDVLRDFRSRNK